MDCSHFTAPGDEELLGFVLDEEPLSKEAREHLEQCEICQQRLARYRQTYASLVSHLYRRECPTGTRLSLYCAGLLPTDEQMSIATHLLACPLCAAEAADTRRFLATVDPLPAPTSSLRDTGRQVVASLVKQQAQLVVRSEAAESPWPRQYRADSINLSLHLSRARSGEYLLLGIITDPNESIEAFTGMTAELYPAADGKDANRAKKPLLSEQVDDLGNIVFSALPVGNYVMIIHLGERELVIEGLDIQPG